MKRRYNGKSTNWQSKWANSGNVGGYANHIEIEHTQYVMCGQLHSGIELANKRQVIVKLTLWEILQKNSRFKWLFAQYKWIKIMQINGSLEFLTAPNTYIVPRGSTNQVNVTNDHLICIWTGVDFDDIPENEDLEYNPDCTVIPGNHDKIFSFQHSYDGAVGQYFQQRRWERIQQEQLEKVPILGLKMTLREAIVGSQQRFKRAFKIVLKLKLYLTKMSITKTLEAEESMMSRQPDTIEQADDHDRSQQAPPQFRQPRVDAPGPSSSASS